MNEKTDGWMDGWMDGRTDGRIELFAAVRH